MQRLREALRARERQLERKSGEVAQVQAVCDQLQVCACRAMDPNSDGSLHC